MYNSGKTALELWAVMDDCGAVMYTRGGSSSTPRLMVYPTKEKAELALKNPWIRQIIPASSKAHVIKIYQAPTGKGKITLGLVDELHAQITQSRSIGDWKRCIKAFATKHGLSDREAIDIANRK